MRRGNWAVFKFFFFRFTNLALGEIKGARVCAMFIFATWGKPYLMHVGCGWDGSEDWILKHLGKRSLVMDYLIPPSFHDGKGMGKR